ncbi:MAG: HEAT repeat domain-containing protein [Armatimonadota bacterium]
MPVARLTSLSKAQFPFASGLLADGILAEDVSTADHLNSVLLELLEGAWRTQTSTPTWARDPVGRTAVESFLGPLAWQLFRNEPAANRFHLEAWRSAWEKAIALVEAPPVMCDQLLKDLVALGLLIDGASEEEENSCWSFAPPTLLGYLAAIGLSKHPVAMRWLLDEPKPFKHNPFWFSPEWLSTLTFLAAIMGDATPLIQATDVPPLNDGKPASGDDIFGQMFGLKCRFAGAAPKTPENFVAPLARSWLEHWNHTIRGPLVEESWDRILERGRMLSGHPAFSVHCTIPLIAQLQGALSQLSDNSDVKEFTDRAVTLVHTLDMVGDYQIVDPLLAMRMPNHWSIQESIARLIGKLGDQRTISFLINKLECGAPPTGFFALCLGELGDPQAITPLLNRWDAMQEATCSIDEFKDYYLGIAYALCDLGAFSCLLQRLDHLSEDHFEIWHRSIEACGNSGNPDSFIHLLALLDEKIKSSDKSAWIVIEALGNLGDDHAVPTLLTLLGHDEYQYLQETIVEALGKLGNLDVADRLLAFQGYR